MQELDCVTACRVSPIVDNALASIQQLNQIEATCKRQVRQPIMSTVQRPLLGAAKDRDKHFAFFSLIELVSDTLQNDAMARRHILLKSKDWGTGDLYMKEPTMLRDFEDGTRFRWSPAAKPFPVGENQLRVRVVIDTWVDDMTVCMGVMPSIR